MSTNGNIFSVNLSWLTYHNLASRPWASRHRRGRSGWKGCTGQTKRHKRRRRCRLCDETATWKTRGRNLSQSLPRFKNQSSVIDILRLSPDFRVKSLWLIRTMSPRSTGKGDTCSPHPLEHVRQRWAAMRSEPITVHTRQLSSRWAAGIRAEDLGASER